MERHQIVCEFVKRWKDMNGGRPRVTELLRHVMMEVGSNPHVYDHSLGSLVITHERPNKEHTSRDYAVDIVAELDGNWLVKHRRASGRMPREARALHPSNTRARRVFSELGR